MTLIEFKKRIAEVHSKVQLLGADYLIFTKSQGIKESCVTIFKNEIKESNKSKLFVFVEISKSVYYITLDCPIVWPEVLDGHKNPKITKHVNFNNTAENFFSLPVPKIVPIIDISKKEENSFRDILSGIEEMLVEKDKRYGNSALNPLFIFSNKTLVGQRLDDKLARIKNSPELRLNDIADLMGYLTLVMKEKKWTKDDILKLID